MKTTTFILAIAILLLSGCELMKKELKKANTIRKSAQEVCECSSVGVSTNVSNGYSTVTVTANNYKGSQEDEKAEEIYLKLQQDYPEICKNDEVVIEFKSGAISSSYSFTECEIKEESDSMDSTLVSR